MTEDKSYLPLCNYCLAESGPVNAAEWNFTYGKNPQNDYGFSCTKHIPDLIKSIEKGKHGEVRVGYLEKWNSNNFYDENWNKSWSYFYDKKTR